jgi:hypothetical protein
MMYEATTPGAFRVAGIAASDDGADENGHDPTASTSWRTTTIMEEEVAVGDVDLIPVQAELAPEELLPMEDVTTTTPSSLQQDSLFPDHENSPNNAVTERDEHEDAAVIGQDDFDTPEMALSVKVIKDDDDGDGRHRLHRSRAWWWLGGGLLLVVVVVVVVVVTVVVTSSSSSSSSNTNHAPTFSPSVPVPTMEPTVRAALVAGVPTSFTLDGNTLTSLSLLPMIEAGTNSQFGSAVALDATGTIMAVGIDQFTPMNQTKLLRRVGRVQVYQQQQQQQQQWTPLGNAIVGQDDQDYVGRSVALSSSGQVMAVGAFGYNSQAGVVRVYQYQSQNSSWVQLGNDLEAGTQGEVGWGTMAFSSDGMILAFGGLSSNFNSTCQQIGIVQVVTYDASRNVWRRRGQNLMGKACEDQFGNAVAMSEDGTVVAVGARYYNGVYGNITYGGLVQVYQYQSTTASWQHLGQDIVGKNEGDRMGRAVSLSATGRTLCVGASQAEANGTFVPGYAQVYTLQQDMTWLPQGQVLYGNHTGDYFGGNVALSDDGTVLAICARQSSHSIIIYRGYCQLYGLLSNSTNDVNDYWEPIGPILQGRASYDQFGGALALSRNGKIIAIGAAQDTDNQTLQQGYVQVYEAQQQS